MMARRTGSDSPLIRVMKLSINPATMNSGTVLITIFSPRFAPMRNDARRV